MTDAAGDKRYVRADGEKVAPAQIDATHVLHPGASSSFQRSGLLIGARGAGKTFLLRHRRRTTHIGAVHMNLASVLSSISRDAGIGGRSVQFNQTQSAKIAAKTAALVTAETLKQCCTQVQDDMQLDLRIMDYLLPPVLRASGPATSGTAYELFLAIDSCPLDSWPPHDTPRRMVDVLATIGSAYPHELALFLDRAEDVTSPSVVLLMGLLDQSVDVLTVIAARPGIAQLMPNAYDPTLVPGDHYALTHIGASPRSEAWRDFVMAATRNYLEANGEAIHDDLDLGWVCRMARDSVRWAIEFSQMALEDPENIDSRLSELTAIRELCLTKVRAQLLPDYPDFAHVLGRLQDSYADRLRDEEQFLMHVHVADYEGQISMFGRNDTLRDYLMRTIRAEALCLPEGHHWHPYELPTELEVLPLFIWDGRNVKWIQ